VKVSELELDGVRLFVPSIIKDRRGSFTEKLNINHVNDFNIKQINQSVSDKNVFRGFHFQKKPKEQAKYVWVESGAILDIVINIQPDSPDYKKYLIVELTDSNNHHLLVPKGFAHGFISLFDNSKVCYAVDNFYNMEYDSGINFMDESLQIDWPINTDSLIVSDKDKHLPMLK
tara:strand:- start:10089 stop:10607 length:519 start_codon:yes stop_codon:yes gene_type:complete